VLNLKDAPMATKWLRENGDIALKQQVLAPDGYVTAAISVTINGTCTATIAAASGRFDGVIQFRFWPLLARSKSSPSVTLTSRTCPILW
jgi:hypothetical protein